MRMGPPGYRAALIGLMAALCGCAAAGGPTMRAASDARPSPGCSSPTAIALANRNASEDSPSERRPLPC